MKSKIDAIHFCFRNKKATEKIVNQFLENFPNSKVSLIVDKGGFDFSYMNSDRIKAFHFDDYNMGGTGDASYLEKHRMLAIFSRIKTSIQFLNCKYVLILEDDVLVKANFDPESSGEFVVAGAVGPNFPDDFKSQNPDLKISHWGLGGGAAFSKSHFLELYDECIDYIDKNHDSLFSGFRPMGAFDCCATFHFARHGHQLKTAPWLQNGNVVHPWKEMYPPGWHHSNQVEWENQ